MTTDRIRTLHVVKTDDVWTAERATALRTQLGMTVEEFADRINVAGTRVVLWEMTSSGIGELRPGAQANLARLAADPTFRAQRTGPDFFDFEETDGDVGPML